MHVYAYFVYMYCIVAVVEAGGICTGVRGSHIWWCVWCVLSAVRPAVLPLLPSAWGGGEGYYC